jgi:peroxiredoxin Q/BCP
MPVELRKRKASEAAPAAISTKKKSTVSKVTDKLKDVFSPSKKTDGDVEVKEDSALKIDQGRVIPLDTFGGEIQTNDGKKTTLKQLVEASKSGVVLFTYPKASTPGCPFTLSNYV